MISTRSRRAAGSPPDRWTWMTPSRAASPNTRAQVAVSSSSPRLSSCSGLEQYGQASGHRWVSSASSPSGRGSFSELCAISSELQKLLVGERAQQCGDVGQDPIAGRRKRRREVIDDLPEARLSGAALEDLSGDGVR